MKSRTAAGCLLFNFAFVACVFAEVDLRPLPVKVIPAYPQLEWPEWLRGLDTGKARDPRPLLSRV